MVKILLVLYLQKEDEGAPSDKEGAPSNPPAPSPGPPLQDTTEPHQVGCRLLIIFLWFILQQRDTLSSPRFLKFQRQDHSEKVYIENEILVSLN